MPDRARRIINRKDLSGRIKQESLLGVCVLLSVNVKRMFILWLLGLLTRIDAAGISGLLPVNAPLRTIIYAFVGKQLLISLLINQCAASAALDVAFHIKTIFREFHFTLPSKPYSRSAAVAETYPCLMSLKTSSGSRSWGSP